MQQETVVAMAWTGGLVLAMGGVFAYEVATFEMDTFAVDHGAEQAVLTQAVSLQAGDESSFAVEIPAGASSVRVALEWTDDVGAADTFSLGVVRPDGEASGPQEGMASFQYEWAQVVPTTAQGVDASHAEDQVELDDWSGTWDVTVRLVDAPGDSLLGLEIAGDGGQDAQLTVSYLRVVAS